VCAHGARRLGRQERSKVRGDERQEVINGKAPTPVKESFQDCRRRPFARTVGHMCVNSYPQKKHVSKATGCRRDDIVVSSLLL